MKKTLIILMITPFYCKGEVLEIKNKPSILEFRIITESIKPIESQKNEINRIKYIISLIEYSLDPYNSDELKNLEELVPSIEFLIKENGKEIRSLILEYALTTNNIYLKKRAVYLLEKIESRKIDLLFNEFYGAGYKSEKLETLRTCIDRGDSSINQFFPPQGEEINLPKK
jgi:hypothetical protein